MFRLICVPRIVGLLVLLCQLIFIASTVFAVDTACPSTLSPDPHPTENPAAAACGLPAQGCIVETVTYTLTADCTQTGPLYINKDSITVTIDGKGYSVDASAVSGSFHFIQVGDTSRTLNVKDVTIEGGGASVGAIEVYGPSTLENVTFRGSNRLAFRANTLGDGSTPASTLKNILIEEIDGVYYLDGGLLPTAILASAGATVSVENLFLRSNFFGNAAVGTQTQGKVTLTGCLTTEHIYPQLFHGSVTNNSSGRCRGTIGNGDSAARKYSPPRPAACGLPREGVLERHAVYKLRGNCQQTGALFIPKEVSLTIEGNGFTIRGARATDRFSDTTVDARSGRSFFYLAGPTTIRNAVIADGTGYVLRAYLGESHKIEHSIFRNNIGIQTIYDSQVLYSRVVFENNPYSRSTFASLSAAGDGALLFTAFSANLTVRDAIFRNNSGAGSLLHGGPSIGSSTNPTVRLEGCLTSTGNTMPNIVDPNNFITDASSGACPPFAFGSFMFPPDSEAPRSGYRRFPSLAACESQGDVEALPMGSIACIFRRSFSGDTLMAVYEIDPESFLGHP